MKLYLKVILISSALLIGTIAGFILCGARINLTGSMPIGIYLPKRQIVLQRNDWVAVCLPNEVAKTGLQSGYLLSGSCKDSNAMPVLKQLIAIPGDTIEVTLNAMIVNGKSIQAKIQTHDHFGRAIKTQSKLGVKMITNQYWIYGNASNLSWDSRYYGGVDRSNILGSYKPFLVF